MPLPLWTACQALSAGGTEDPVARAEALGFKCTQTQDGIACRHSAPLLESVNFTHVAVTFQSSQVRVCFFLRPISILESVSLTRPLDGDWRVGWIKRPGTFVDWGTLTAAARAAAEEIRCIMQTAGSFMTPGFVQDGAASGFRHLSPSWHLVDVLSRPDSVTR